VYAKSVLRKAGCVLSETNSPMIPVEPGSTERIADLKQRLLAAGIYPPFLKYPGSPSNGYFRFIISSEHSRAQLDNLLRVMTNLENR
jgi:7-keto-8-aminopelargonate synthetase-like enzyme